MIDNDEEAKKFIIRLPHLTEQILSEKIDAVVAKRDLKSLVKLFDTFAVVDEFTSFQIVDCYNEIKISLMKWNRFADKTSDLAGEFKQALDHFYEVMKELYFLEIFGFFSTSVWPVYVPEVKLPCRLFCGCVEGWEKEPYLDENGNAVYANVIRFQDPENHEVPLCITIENPHLLESREKCSLSDEQLKILIDFVTRNKDIIIFHCTEDIADSIDFIDALKLKNNSSILKQMLAHFKMDWWKFKAYIRRN